MASTPTTRSNPILGCLGKFLFLVILSLTSGTIGWLMMKTWLAQITSGEPTSFNSDFLNNTNSPADLSSKSLISQQEQQRKAEIQTQRVKLNINSVYFNNLVDQFFVNRYPSQRGKILSQEPADKQWRDKWDEVAKEVLEKLQFLSQDSRRGLGKYDEETRQQWIQQVNELNLSSRALYDLTDATFFFHFPEQVNKAFIEQPIGQVWQAIAYDQLTALKNGTIYQKESQLDTENEKVFTATISPGEGRAYVVKLQESQQILITLNTDKKTLLSVYSPTGQNNLLEDSPQRKWTGVLPESGYYEFIVVSKTQEKLQYELTIEK